jgi:hypothetical protein
VQRAGVAQGEVETIGSGTAKLLGGCGHGRVPSGRRGVLKVRPAGVDLLGDIDRSRQVAGDRCQCRWIDFQVPGSSKRIG